MLKAAEPFPMEPAPGKKDALKCWSIVSDLSYTVSVFLVTVFMAVTEWLPTPED
jgi:hypothetical protein